MDLYAARALRGPSHLCRKGRADRAQFRQGIRVAWIAHARALRRNEARHPDMSIRVIVSSRGPRMTGRRDRFQALYEANYHRVLGYALRRTSRDDAADVVAETFLVAWRRLEEVPNGDAARLWLYATARRVLMNQQRGARRRDRLALRIATDLPEGTRTEVVDPDIGRAGAAFAALQPADRELLGLVAWEGLDAGAIARVLGCSRNAARIRIHRARRRFARELVRIEESAKQNAVGGHVSEAYE